MPGIYLLLDQGLPRDAAELLRGSGVTCIHVSEMGMSASSDTEILEWARAHEAIVITLDADFHAILSVNGASKPSVIRIRLERMKGPTVAGLLHEILDIYSSELRMGCMITVKQRKTTCHLLTTPD